MKEKLQTRKKHLLYLLQVYNFQKLSETAGVGHFIQAVATGKISKEYFLENRKQRGFL